MQKEVHCPCIAVAYSGIIEKYTNLKVDQDPKTKDISINVEITPYFAAQNFFIELTGRNTAAGVDWEQNTKNA